MITDLRTTLDGLEGDLVAGWGLIVLAFVWALGSLVVALAKVDRGPRGESMSERHDRLDRDAPVAPPIPLTRPASSNRKASRVPTGGTR